MEQNMFWSQDSHRKTSTPAPGPLRLLVNSYCYSFSGAGRLGRDADRSTCLVPGLENSCGRVPSRLGHGQLRLSYQSRMHSRNPGHLYATKRLIKGGNWVLTWDNLIQSTPYFLTMHLNIILPPVGQRQPGRPRRRWDNNIKMDLNP